MLCVQEGVGHMDRWMTCWIHCWYTDLTCWLRVCKMWERERESVRCEGCSSTLVAQNQSSTDVHLWDTVFQPVSEKVLLCNSKKSSGIQSMTTVTEQRTSTPSLSSCYYSLSFSLWAYARANTHIPFFLFRSIILYRPSQFCINFIVNVGVELRARLCALLHCNL